MSTYRGIMGVVLFGTLVTIAAGYDEADREVARSNIGVVKKKLEDEGSQIRALHVLMIRLNTALMGPQSGDTGYGYSDDTVRSTVLLSHRKTEALGRDWLRPDGWGLTNRDQIVALEKDVRDSLSGKGPLGKTYFSSLLGPLSQLGQEVLEIDAGEESNTTDNRYCRDRVASLYRSVVTEVTRLCEEHQLAHGIYRKQLDEYNKVLGTNVGADPAPADWMGTTGTSDVPDSGTRGTAPMRILGQTAASPTATPAAPAGPVDADTSPVSAPEPESGTVWSEFDTEVRDLRAAIEQYKTARSLELRARLIEARTEYLEAARELESVIATSPDPGDIERFGEIRAGMRDFWRGTVVSATRSSP